MKYILIILLLLGLNSCELFPGDEEAEETEPALPTSVSTIQTSPQIVKDTEFIVLDEPKPFRTIKAENEEIQFIFWIQEADNYSSLPTKEKVENGEIYIFNKEPDINSLRAGNTEGCIAGISNLANHSFRGMIANLSTNTSDNQFYECGEGLDLLSKTEKIRLDQLDPGIYYWFVLGYNEDLAISHSSEIRSFTKE